jgi:2-keto-4-pentenoate hydratase/2-oxohepta-3-ene-1,7-dioic acid hydratase in catechol pathway
LLALLSAGGAARDLAAQLCESALGGNAPHSLHSVEDIGLLAPVPLPTSIRDCMCFEEHLLGAMRTVVRWRFPPLSALDRLAKKLFGRGLLKVPAVWHERPLYYKGNPHSVVGHGAEVIWPAATERLDFEVEFGVFIGRAGKDIPESQATDHIAGYTIFNDFSARDVQLREMQGRLGPAKGKDFDTGNVIGPSLVTPDELADPYGLAAEVCVNGEPWSQSSTASMRFSFEEIIAYISRDETLHVGDFIGAGTLPGGCGLELDRWITPGDTVELQIDGLGTLRNRVIRGHSMAAGRTRR